MNVICALLHNICLYPYSLQVGLQKQFGLRVALDEKLGERVHSLGSLMC